MPEPAPWPRQAELRGDSGSGPRGSARLFESLQVPEPVLRAEFGNPAWEIAMDKKKVLLVGETWVSAATHYKGFDQFSSVTFHSGIEPLVAALADSDFALTHMPAHEAVEALPFTLEGLDRYEAIILSDVGA